MVEKCVGHGWMGEGKGLAILASMTHPNKI